MKLSVIAGVVLAASAVVLPAGVGNAEPVPELSEGCAALNMAASPVVDFSLAGTSFNDGEVVTLTVGDSVQSFFWELSIADASGQFNNPEFFGAEVAGTLIVQSYTFNGTETGAGVFASTIAVADPRTEVSTVTCGLPPAELCPPGFFSATGNVPCTPAPAGSFVDQAGATEATLCPVGTFSAAEAAVECTPAPAGSFVDQAGATEATLCPAGRFQPSDGAISCQPAPIGTYVDQPGAIAATLCPAGSTTAGIGSTSLADCIPIDSDGDGVPDVDDLCPGTTVDPAPDRLKPNRNWPAPTETFGCSPSQIIDDAGLGGGHSKFGISNSALAAWIASVSN